VPPETPSRKGPTIIAVGGFESNVGKTTLICDLLRAFPGWEAIKTTRGHYRSCGRAEDTCCVSGLLGDHATVYSGRDETFAPGKDTGRYWEAGALNVHWVIGTGKQIEDGIKIALGRVKAPGVFIEGNTITQFVSTDFFVQVTPSNPSRIKPSAKRALAHTRAVYVSGQNEDRSRCDLLLKSLGYANVPIYSATQFSLLRDTLRALCQS
jgi:molybdopterin-guanine dinucleotide biosynthesis protein